MNAAAIDRRHLVAMVQAAQRALGDRTLLRFNEFAQARGGAVYELSSFDAIERAFTQFEWAEMDRLYTAIFLRLVRYEAVDDQSVVSSYREVLNIVSEKLKRFSRKRLSRTFRAVRQTASLLFLSVMFMVVSSISSEACLHLLTNGKNIQRAK